MWKWGWPFGGKATKDLNREEVSGGDTVNAEPVPEDLHKDNFPEEYEKGDYSSDVQSFKRLCSQLRGRIAETSPTENRKHFKFVLTEQEKLTWIVEWYQKKYGDDEAVKEVLAFLNCAYGVQNEELFLAASSEASDSLNNHSWDKYDFIAMRLPEHEVIDFRCKRNSSDGSFDLDYSSQELTSEFTGVLMEAVSFYRNAAEREAFFEEYKRNHNGANIYALKKERHKALFASLKRSYEEEWQRIGNNPLADTLRKLVTLCEERAFENGFGSTVINQPASGGEIEQWEQAHGVRLPESYRHFLRFANGVQLLNDSEKIFGLDGIGSYDEHLETDYISIGTMIGDGTTLCLSRTTGEAYVEDHGGYKRRGDFKELLEYLIDFLWEA